MHQPLVLSSARRRPTGRHRTSYRRRTYVLVRTYQPVSKHPSGCDQSGSSVTQRVSQPHGPRREEALLGGQGCLCLRVTASAPSESKLAWYLRRSLDNPRLLLQWFSTDKVVLGPTTSSRPTSLQCKHSSCRSVLTLYSTYIQYYT